MGAVESVAPPDEDVRREATRRLARLSLPVGSLGRLGDLAAWIAACQGRCPPEPLHRPRVVLFAADHGVAAGGVSAYPPFETAARVAAVRRGDAAVNAFAATAGAGVRVVDVGLADPDPTAPHTDIDPGPGPASGRADRRRVRAGSGRIDREDALTEDQTEEALRVGQEVADEEVDAGADLLIPGELGVGVSTPVAVLAAALTGREPVAVVGRGSGIDDTTWMRKTAAVRDALRRARAVGRAPRALLRTVGGADLAALTGFLDQAARRRTPVLLDGAAVGVAALLADARTTGVASWWAAANRDAEPAQALALEILGLDPLLLLELRAGQGIGGLAALPLVAAAVRTLRETAPRPTEPAETAPGPAAGAHPVADG